MENEKKAEVKKKLVRPREKAQTGGAEQNGKEELQDDKAKEEQMEDIIADFKKNGGIVLAFSKKLVSKTDEKKLYEGGAVVHIKNMPVVNAVEVLAHCLQHVIKDKSILEKMCIREKIIKELLF